MKPFFIFFVFFLSCSCFSQNITVNSQSFTPQQLIEDVLIGSQCIDNVIVNNAVSGDFGGSDLSYGFFDATNTNFPFESGIVMSTGRLSNVPGPNTSLSDDDASGWGGDNDLEVTLNENNTFNATILEFDFTSLASEISFRYLFASEEYQEGNPNTCNFSDLFGFLIRPANSNGPYTNIALIPGTQTPVKVTTVHSGIPGSCPPINQAFFDTWNGTDTPINFNGQTEILTATAQVTANETYHIKLVIADEQNFRFDSAVFLEAGSFQPSTDLGVDRLLANNNPVCEGNTVELNAQTPGALSYNWFRDGTLVQVDPIGCLNCGTFTVDQAGTYTVEVDLGGNCIANGEILIEYTPNPIVTDSILTECDTNMDGIIIYNLFEAESALTNNNPNLFVSNFFLDDLSAIANSNPITTFSNFESSEIDQVVYARVEDAFNCVTIAELVLVASNNTLTIPFIEACDFDAIDGFTTFDLQEVVTEIESQIPADSEVYFFENLADAADNTNANALPINYNNITPSSQTIYVKVETNNQCFAVSPVNLNVLSTPSIMADETIVYCTNTFPETIRLFGGILNDIPNNFYYEWQLNGTPLSTTTSFIDINEIGEYTVIITHPNGCSNSRVITVTGSEIAQITNIDVVGSNNSNTISVTVTGSGSYQYALDYNTGPYQDQPVFINVSAGFHTLHVNDKNGCGIVSELFSVLGFPKFFTPNGDTQNDTWQLDGVNFDTFPNLIVTIYDRHGKILHTQNAKNDGWDGIYNGNIMPNSDYWFIATLGDNRQVSGHFSLKR